MQDDGDFSGHRDLALFGADPLHQPNAHAFKADQRCVLCSKTLAPAPIVQQHKRSNQSKICAVAVDTSSKPFLFHEYFE
jgi:hypothetical protein